MLSARTMLCSPRCTRGDGERSGVVLSCAVVVVVVMTQALVVAVVAKR
jgi:hypothetical protein